MTKHCITCDSKIENSNKKYCSRQCDPETKIRKYSMPCVICGNSFYTKTRNNRSQTCSSECNKIHRENIEIIDFCITCEKQISKKNKGHYGVKRFCGQKCKDKYVKYMTDEAKKVHKAIRSQLLAMTYKQQIKSLKEFVKSFN